MLLPRALQRAIDRLIDAVMLLAQLVAPFGTNRASPAEPAQHARTLLQRLSLLVIRLIRLSNNPLPTPRQTTTPAHQPDRDTTPAGTERAPASCLPRRPGWLLAILPDAAPAVAAELHAALADPALAPLLAAVPTLHRDLRPLLRALGLDAPAAPPPDLPPPAPSPTPPPLPVLPAAPTCAAPSHPAAPTRPPAPTPPPVAKQPAPTTPFHVQYVTF